MWLSAAIAARARALERVTEATVDLLVIGAGILGSRVAFEAAGAGLRVALIDAGDVGGATSAASSKLVHGGLRYLASGDFRLVNELRREQGALANRVAPHLVRASPLVLAVEKHDRRRVPQLDAALALYSAASGFRRPLPRRISSAHAKALVPPLEIANLAACGLVTEAQTHDARLTLATARAAARHGAEVLNYVRVTALEQGPGGVYAAVLQDEYGGTPLTVSCRAIVNASGPWVDGVRRLDSASARPLVRLSKGVHAVLPLDEAWSGGLAIFDRLRSAIALPWQGMLLLGATDTAHGAGPSTVTADAREIETLLGTFRRVLPPEQLRLDRVVHSFAGLRTLAIGAQSTESSSRRHVIDVSERGMVSIAGGKLTNHRVIALDALRRLPPAVRPRIRAPSDEPLAHAAAGGPVNAAQGIGDPDVAAHLLHLYGPEVSSLLAYTQAVPDALDRVHPAGPDVWAQVYFAREQEWALSVDDLAGRRTTLAVRGLASPKVRSLLANAVSTPRHPEPDARTTTAGAR